MSCEYIYTCDCEDAKSGDPRQCGPNPLCNGARNALHHPFGWKGTRTAREEKLEERERGGGRKRRGVYA